MATATVILPASTKNRLPKNIKLAPENERFMRACSDIASALIQDHEAQEDSSKPKKDVNLNSLRGQMAKKHRLSTQPPLTAIIAAVPEHYKKYILPKLIAKPIRTCSLKFKTETRPDWMHRHLFRHRRCCRNVQAPSLSSHRIYWKYLCLLPRRSRFGF